MYVRHRLDDFAETWSFKFYDINHRYRSVSCLAINTIFGFGLATLLMPIVAIFFPVVTAISLTAFVHLLNNLFKLTTF